MLNIFFYLCTRPQIQIQPIDAGAIRSALDTWLQSTESDSKQSLKVVIDNINSVRTIHNINTAVSELGTLNFDDYGIKSKNIQFIEHFEHFSENPSNWKQILESLHLGSNIDFYHKFYLPLMQDRIKTIITVSWTAAVERTDKNIREIFESDSSTLIGNFS